jgi:c-di-GMP-binding flagellar brake protein YcgR
MENRRKEYRHTFSEAEHPSAQLTRIGEPQTLTGAVLSLSAGGMGVQFWPPTAADLPAGPWLVRLTLGPGQQPVSVTALLRHVHGEDALLYGFQFLPSADPSTHAALERRIWAFLLEVQRRARTHQVAQR